jgi:hypothetical protein
LETGGSDVCCVSATQWQGKSGVFGAAVVAMCLLMMVVTSWVARPVAYADELPARIPRLCLTAGTDANGGQGCRSGDVAESWEMPWQALGYSGLTPEGAGSIPGLGVSRTPRGGGAGPAWPWSGWTHLETMTAVERPDRPLCAAPVGAARRHEKPAESATGIIPGNRGKVSGNWCRPPLHGASHVRQISPVPLDGVAADPVLRQRSCAAKRELRNRVRAESGPGPVSGLALMQLPRGFRLLLYNQDAAQCSGGSTPPKGPARKAGRGRDRAQRGAGESGKARKTSSLGRRVNPRHPTASRKQPER